MMIILDNCNPCIVKFIKNEINKGNHMKKLTKEQQTYWRAREIAAQIAALPEDWTYDQVAKIFRADEGDVFRLLDQSPSEIPNRNDWEWMLRRTRNNSNALFNRLSGKMNS